MASACVNNLLGISPESFIDCPPSSFPAYGWLSPRLSFSREHSNNEDDDSKLFSGAKPEKNPPKSDPTNYHGDFEFRLDDPTTMLPADVLFSGGRLFPLQLTACAITPAAPGTTKEAVRSPAIKKSPKAPRCSSRWRELLGLKKKKQENNSTATNTTSSSSSPTKAGKSIRQLLHRTSKSMSFSDASLRLPLLRDSADSKSSHDHDEFPRLSLDADTKPYLNNPRLRTVKLKIAVENPKPLIDHPSAPAPTNPTLIPRQLTMDSPRMNPAGKIVFESLERSCSSPSSFNGGGGGGRSRSSRGVQRSYSANVRVAPLLNVPVCSKSGVLGFGQLFSKKKEANGGGGSSNGNTKPYHQHSHCNCRLRRTSS